MRAECNVRASRVLLPQLCLKKCVIRVGFPSTSDKSTMFGDGVLPRGQVRRAPPPRSARGPALDLTVARTLKFWPAKATAVKRMCQVHGVLGLTARAGIGAIPCFLPRSQRGC